MEITPTGTMLFIENKDVPGVIGVGTFQVNKILILLHIFLVESLIVVMHLQLLESIINYQLTKLRFYVN